jgi:hypothetical protein
MRHSLASAPLAALLAVAVGAAPHTLGAQRPAQRPAARAAADAGAFVVRLGTDTVAVERFTRTGDRVEGDVFNRTGAAPRVTHYVVTLDAAGRPTRAELRTRRPDGSAVPNSALGATITFRGDSAFADVQLPDSTAHFKVDAPAGAVPSIQNSFAMWELALRSLRTAGRQNGAVSLWGRAPAGGGAARAPRRRRLGGGRLLR